MAINNLNLSIGIESKKAVKQLNKAAKAANKLINELEKLKNIEIGLSIVSINKKWWQFWK